MILKTDKHQYFFEVLLKRTSGTRGELTVSDVPQPIIVSTPSEFQGGEDGFWSPEHLFLSALSSCFMSTYLAIAKKKGLAVYGFECSTIGQINLVKSHLEFTLINLFPKIFVEKEKEIPLGNDILLKTYKQCLVSNSIKSKLVHHGEVLLKPR